MSERQMVRICNRDWRSAENEDAIAIVIFSVLYHETIALVKIIYFIEAKELCTPDIPSPVAIKRVLESPARSSRPTCLQNYVERAFKFGKLFYYSIVKILLAYCRYFFHSSLKCLCLGS